MKSNAKARSSKGVEDINQLSFQKSFTSAMQNRYNAPKSYAERRKSKKYIGNASPVKLVITAAIKKIIDIGTAAPG